MLKLSAISLTLFWVLIKEKFMNKKELREFVKKKHFSQGNSQGIWFSVSPTRAGQFQFELLWFQVCTDSYRLCP